MPRRRRARPAASTASVYEFGRDPDAVVIPAVGHEPFVWKPEPPAVRESPAEHVREYPLSVLSNARDFRDAFQQGLRERFRGADAVDPNQLDDRPVECGA